MCQDIVFVGYTENDRSLLQAVFQNPRVMEFTLDDLFSDQQLDRYFAAVLRNNLAENRKTFEYAVYSQDTYIGFADFTIYNRNSSGGVAEIGYLLLPEFWGNGYGSLIAGKLIDLCFNRHKLHKVIAKCNAGNTGSEKVMIRNGMKKEGHLKEQRFKNGIWADELVYAILKD